MEILTLNTDAGHLDVLSDMPARNGRRLTYDDLESEAVERPVGPGVAVRVASTEAIIASKEWADRPKDREALPELRRLAERTTRPPPRSTKPARS